MYLKQEKHISLKTGQTLEPRGFKGLLYKKNIFFLQNNSVAEQFWHYVKGLCTLTSKLSISRSHATIVNEYLAPKC